MDVSRLLSDAVEQIPGAVAISLLGLDGVAVETVAGTKPLPGTARARLPDDAATAAWEVEIAELMQTARRAARSLNWGPLRQLTLETRELTFVLRLVRAEYVLLLAVENEANVGRARFEVQRLAGLLAEATDGAA